MKRRRLVLLNIALLAALFSIGALVEYILSLNNLSFRNSVISSASIAAIILILTLILQLQAIMLRACKNPQIRMPWRVLSGTALALSAAAAIAFSILLTVLGAFAYNPEHVVEKDGRNMVAYVNSFLQVRVEYYDYKNVLVRGSILRIEEDYGNGGYDPFTEEHMPQVKRFIYYNEDGSVEKSNW